VVVIRSGCFGPGCSGSCRAFPGQFGGMAVVDVRRGVEADAGVLVVVVVPVHEPADNAPASWTEANRSGNSGPYFRVLNRALAVRVVITHPGSGVGPGDVQIRE
jgi:hypothetical protein